MSSEVLAFSESQQAAVLGHAIKRPEIFSVLEDLKVNRTWFIDAPLGDMWEYISAFRSANRRPPVSWEEVVDSIRDDGLYRTAAKRTADRCDKNHEQYQWDVLEKKLISWSRTEIIFNRIKDIGEKHNSGKHDDAYKSFVEGNFELQKLETSVGLTQDSFVSSADRVKDEERQRLEEQSKILPYGIKYFQDSIGGILPSDIVLIGAASGVGKTEAAKICSQYVSELQKPTYYFALEAEDNEIERRIKFGMMGEWYRDDHLNIPRGMITYRNFRYNRLQQEFAPYQSRAESEFEKKYRSLHTYYIKRGLFTIRDLEKEFYKIRNDAALIALDHIHYVDFEDGDNENYEMTRLIKTIKNLAAVHHIPFILVSHLRKKDRKAARELIPDLDSFHGSSNITKICTQALVIAPAYGFVAVDAKAAGVPTFMKAVKVRVDGSAIYNTGVGFFNTYTNQYTPYYAIGRLSRDGSKWTPVTDLPYWADKNSLVTDCGEVT